jgi:3-hydroxy-9,10-secoandrosta-1,3,5(10)-triene-9,17-dione monooxygenase
MPVDIEPLCQELRNCRAETNANRMMLGEIRERVRDSGVARILQPRNHGGAGGPLRNIVAALTRIGGACGSSGWVIAQYILHNYMVSHWPAAGREAVWGKDPKALVAGILVPSFGCYEVMEDGYSVSGRWPWVTGVDTCDWCMVTAYEKDRPGPETHRHFLLQRKQVEIHDTWHAIGLRGSGTNDVELSRVFVPHHLSLAMAELRGGESPGGQWRDNPLYLLPSYSIFGLGITSGAVGIAQEITAEYNAVVRKKTSVMSEKSVADFSSQQIKFAEAKCGAGSAVEILRFAADEFLAIASEEGRAPSDLERARCRALATFAGNMAMDAARTVWDLSGALSVLNSSVLGALYTDLIVANQHFTQNKDPNFKSYGRTLYGLPLDNVTL